VHIYPRSRKKKKGDYCGRCLSQAATNATFAAGIDNPLYRCGNYDAFTQIDMSGGHRTGCYWPQVDMLDDIHRASPDATFVFTMRAFDKWYTSLSKWHEFHKRIANCRLGAYPDGVLAGFNPRKYEEWRVRKALRTFYCDQVKRVREFVLRHPSHNLVEIMVGDPDIGNYLAELFGTNDACWGIHNVNPGSETLASIRNTTNMTVKVARAPPKEKHQRQRQGQRQGEEGRRRRQRDQNNNMTWRQGEAAHFDTEEEEEEEEVPPNTTSYLGFDGVPFGSCYEPHPYFRPNPRTAQITLPIINLGFPKAGTTSFQNFLACAGSYNISHQFCAYLPKVKKKKERRLLW